MIPHASQAPPYFTSLHRALYLVFFIAIKNALFTLGIADGAATLSSTQVEAMKLRINEGVGELDIPYALTYAFGIMFL